METPGEESIRDILRQSLIYLFIDLFILFQLARTRKKLFPICRNPFRIEKLHLVSIEI